MLDFCSEGSALNLSLGMKIDNVDNNLKVLTQHVNKVEGRVDKHDEQIDDHELRLTKLEMQGSNATTGSAHGGDKSLPPRNKRKIFYRWIFRKC